MKAFVEFERESQCMKSFLFSHRTENLSKNVTMPLQVLVCILSAYFAARL